MKDGEVETPARSPKITRRGLLIGSAAAVVGVGVGAAVFASASSRDQLPESREQSPLPPDRVGAHVGAPVDEEDAVRWRTDIDTLAGSGQNLLRTAVYPWLVAPALNSWDDRATAFYRETLAYARDKGMEINLVVPGAPDWAQDFGFDEYVEACTWFWTKMRENFGDQVELWQVYNEADHAHYQLFTPATRDAEYLGEFADLLGTAQRVFGSGDGGRPITTNLTGWPMNDEREQEWYLVLDAIAAQVDVLGFSVYPADNSDEIGRLAERMQRVQERYGKPIFVAETGLQTGPDTWTEEDQKQYVPAAIEQLRSVGLWGLSLYELRDAEPPDAGVEDLTPLAGFGIIRRDGSRKSGFDDIMHALAPR
ncbi:glycosyl hydrolase 53 family protein [Micromonospora sp. DT81.3]|uniref:glycosyl hydrolase 53 family protein n=1 Tax=Micromonospora sp. DT81.3 TaxID=3416523 RepID=UPI003CE97CEC